MRNFCDRELSDSITARCVPAHCGKDHSDFNRQGVFSQHELVQMRLSRPTTTTAPERSPSLSSDPYPGQKTLAKAVRSPTYRRATNGHQARAFPYKCPFPSRDDIYFRMLMRWLVKCKAHLPSDGDGLANSACTECSAIQQLSGE